MRGRRADRADGLPELRQPREAGDRLGLEQAIEGIAQAAEALGIPVVSGNVSLYNDTDGRSIPPTPVVGCVGLVPDVRFVPGAWRSGDVVLLATAPGELDLDAEAALVRFVWKAAPVLTLAHDVSDGGIEQAVREAEEYSGVEAELELADDRARRPGSAGLRARGRRATRRQGSAPHRRGSLDVRTVRSAGART